MVGPFFYIDDNQLKFHDFLYDALPEDKAIRYGEKVTSEVGHSELFEKAFPKSSREYFDYPRGRVVYDTVKKEHIIYLDKCLDSKVKEIAKCFDLTKYRIERDEHYVCKNCIGEIWEDEEE